MILPQSKFSYLGAPGHSCLHFREGFPDNGVGEEQELAAGMAFLWVPAPAIAQFG